MRICLLLAILFIFARDLFAQQDIPPIGLWREHLPYQSAIDVCQGNGKMYCATPYSVFSVGLSDHTVDRLSRVTGLSETGVSGIGFNLLNEKLLIAYKNSNIDILYRNDIFNVPDLERSGITGDKSIYQVFPYNDHFYLSTGLGVIVVNGNKYEVKESWFIGSGGSKIRVNGFTAGNTFYYAATEEGLKRTSMSGPDPSDYQNWQTLSGINGLPAGPCRDVSIIQTTVFSLVNDTVYFNVSNNWNIFFNEPGWQIQSMNSSSGKLVLCMKKPGGSAKLVSLNPDGTIARTILQPGFIANPLQAIVVNDHYWVADSIGGLTKFTSSGQENYKLNSPGSLASGELLFKNKVFYAAAGAVSNTWQKANNRNGLFRFSEGQWTNYNAKQFPRLDSLPDLISVALDPVDESIWAGSFGGGLLRIKSDNSFEIYKQNSPIGQAVFDPGSYRVSGLAFDKNKNLWISNYGASQNIVIRKPDGTWNTLTTPFALIQNAVAQILIDDEDQKWIISPNGNGLLCLNDGQTIGQAGDDRWKLYRRGAGAGNLPSNQVLSIAKDKNGFVWVGTADGIGVIQCPQFVFSSQGCDAVLPVVQQGGFNQFLFKGEEVRSIAVDGADRKWIATSNGIWLVSPEGDKIYFRFTEENSPLLSNDVKRIVIDGKTGEVFFATAKGICSFRSTSTEGSEKNEDVLVFPNPVPPGFNGTIAIRGLVNNAIVKITEANGRLVYQTRALGGQAIWDGKDYRGRRISTGIYLVLVSDDGRKENLATKIIFISK